MCILSSVNQSAMQRKKKVETYDGDLDFFAPAVVPPPQPVPTVSSSQVQNGVDYVHAGAASPQAPAPAIGKNLDRLPTGFNADQLF